jgi:hypothetical protein
MPKRRQILAGVLIAAVLAAIFFIRSNPNYLKLAGVREITLSPTDIVIPRVEVNRVKQNTRYYFRQDGSRYQLYFLTKGTSEKVIGNLPTFTDKPDLEFGGFTDVVSPAGITTYASYEKYKSGWAGSSNLVASELYALKHNRVQKVLSDIKPGGINCVDTLIPLGGACLDQRGNLYVLTGGGMLCVIQDGQIVAKADVSKIGAKQPAFPSMFSDAENTYFLVPKLFNRENSMTGAGPVSESQIKGKYKINF